MKLSEKDAIHYFKLMSSLQFYVNRKLGIIDDIATSEEYSESLDVEEKLEVRDALFADIKLIDSFVKANPDNLAAKDLTIVSKWKKYVGGEFYIERFLKKYAVFIRDDDVYGVSGLHQGFDELIPKSRLPLCVKTYLLPFKGNIVYDGLFQSFNIFFGGGVKRRLKEVYMRAKQNGRIIETLEPGYAPAEAEAPVTPAKNWRPELDALASKAKMLRGGAACPAIYTPAFSLVKAGIEFAQLATSDASDWDARYKALKKVERALNKAARVLDRQE